MITTCLTGIYLIGIKDDFCPYQWSRFSSIVLSITSLSPLDPFFDLFRIGMDGSDVTVLIYV
jgi:hypothetical protein